MKKKFITALICLFATLNLSAQEKIGSYPCSYFETEYDVEASLKDGKYSFYVGIGAESKRTTANLQFYGESLDEFKNKLVKVKSKYEEWTKVAKENNVTKMTKEMDFNLPEVTVCWLGSKWFFSFNKALTPKFMILGGGQPSVVFVKKVTASSNEYIDETIYWVFSSPSEIQKLIDILDFDKIKQKLGGEEKTKELFK